MAIGGPLGCPSYDSNRRWLCFLLHVLVAFVSVEPSTAPTRQMNARLTFFRNEARIAAPQSGKRQPTSWRGEACVLPRDRRQRAKAGRCKKSTQPRTA